MSPLLPTGRPRVARDGAVHAVRTGPSTTVRTPERRRAEHRDGGEYADTTGAAFFDVDNTMMVGASIYHFAKGLAARRLFTSRDLAAFAYHQLRFRLGGTEDPQRIRQIRESALAFVSGRTVAEIVTYCEEIFDETMAGRIWPGTRALAQHHLDAGQAVWLVTATPLELARIIARRLGLTGALGTVSEVEDGAFTGRLVGAPLHGPAKAAAVRELAERDGLDLARCTAYSDSANDLPMLRLVGNPVAINPDSELRRVAKEEGWTIRDFRTGRKAARYAAAAGLVTGALGTAALGAGAVRRRLR